MLVNRGFSSLALAGLLLGVAPVSNRWGAAHAQTPLGTAFTYQGRLTDAGGPASGDHDMTFTLHGHETDTDPVGTPIALTGIPLSDGLFTVQLDFGAAFTGQALWLEIEVEGVTLSPRQPVTPAPYAVRALTELWQPDGPHVHYSAGNVGIGASAPNRPLTVQGTGSGSELLQLRNTDGANRWHMNLSGGGVNLAETGVADFRLYVAPGGNVGIGTSTPNHPLTVRGTASELIQFRTAGANRWHMNLSGGGLHLAETGVADFRLYFAPGGNVGIGTGAPSSRLSVSGSAHFTGNVGIGTTSPGAALQVVGRQILGTGNNTSSGTNSFVSGGALSFPNAATGEQSFVGGGLANAAGGSFSFIGGGRTNSAGGTSSFIGGGQENVAAGGNAFVAGGFGNDAGGTNSFAAGRRAKAFHSSTFVWADSLPADFASTGNNQFLIRATGGVGIGTNSPANPLSVNGSANFTSDVGIGLSNPNSRLHIRHFSAAAIWGIRIQNADQDDFQAGLRMTSTGFLEATNNAQTLTPNVARLDSTGNWTAVSDARAKRDVRVRDGLLDAALALRPVSFRYQNSTGDGDQREHLGLVAQEVEDVLPAFVTGSGQDLRTLNYAGLSTVAIGAVQELKREKDAEIAALRAESAAEIQGLRQEIEELKDMLRRISAWKGE